jgi:hypothetical protein
MQVGIYSTDVITGIKVEGFGMAMPPLHMISKVGYSSTKLGDDGNLRSFMFSGFVPPVPPWVGLVTLHF